MNIAFYTLGCKVNQYETQALEQLLTQRGHTLVSFEGEADVYVINTCSVTAVSDKKSRQVIRRTRKTAPDAIIAVCGCYTQTHPQDMEGLSVDLVSGTGDRTGFVDLLERTWAERQPVTALDDAMKRRTFEVLPAGGLEGRTRAMLKVEDGCVNFCTYCIIPYARGPIRSLPLEEAKAQAAHLAAEGYQELVLTGIEISSWGHELRDGTALIDLVEGICAAAPDCRVRLGSLEPRTVTEDFCRRAAQLPNLCPHFHLSMQSGCDTVLKRMNRKYDTARYYESVALLREWFDRPGITTDLIVGFPGETEEEFGETLVFLRKCAFSAMHIFPYSKRPGTPAAKMPGQVLKSVKEERAHRAANLAAQMERAYLEQWVGETVPVLFEEEREGLWRGYTTRYTEVTAPSDENLHNCLRSVRIKSVEGGSLRGVLV
ncbi:tRNA (N(6)-L-threonylcarbamoyladenosine(37)-C(2))-methylthiotransferase MtaB [Pseudoflavonifractor phocaeensis]|uniref:tRNA (N(6)-L-threonylcarbamoyladenosine(37)-C(2))- methylthiotransferase MtaB n=1 Tax=Pseudoflavonifractor phocaeensis TaxID=1870988 RepID=UPI001F287FDB|nr:tRNA (N(6)-L-threonylcarbamoyladenosine(37)-C(2))-methylthiotransferase MtaB [Pseudoflavonifractor phocaeensis]MCF2661895.1 tRNA (N(6)-L-threonylcarbamoyladenosine(37)-C(2))-methylthiotransferase MtaB [Pseudoflavonifractor phocaeensis]